MPHFTHPFRIAQPATLAEASRLLIDADGGAAVYAGGSELLLAMKQGGLRYDVLVDIKTIPGLDAIGAAGASGTSGAATAGDRVSVGGLATHRSVSKSAAVREAFPLLARLEGMIANPRVRATGTLGGNLCFAEPHSDPATLLLAHDAVLLVAGPDGEREIPVADFTIGSYTTALEPGEILRSIEIPRLGANQLVGYQRVQQLEHRPMLGVAVRLDLDDAHRTVTGARLAVGAASPMPIRSGAAEALLLGDVAGIEARIAEAAAALADAADLLDDADGSAAYKRHLIGVHVRRLVTGLLSGQVLQIGVPRRRRPLEEVVSAWQHGRQRTPPADFKVIGRSLPRTDGRPKVTGAANYTADLVLPNMAHAKILRSPVGHARILSIETAAAKAVPGVLDVITGQDLLTLKRHLFGHAYRDNTILAMEKVVYAGEAVVAVVAEDPATAQRAAELVEISYDELDAMMTPEAALAEGAPLIHEEPHEIGHAPGHINLEGRAPGTNRLTNDVVQWGDIDAAFARAKTIVEGEYYYPMSFVYTMEPYASVADFRGGEVTIHTTGQHTYTTRRDIADIFDLPLSKVRIATPYVGGGFGAKSYSKVEPIAAVCSWRVGRPVKVELTVEETVLTTRALDARVWLRTGVDENGRLIARQARALMNAGAFSQNAMLVSAKTSTRLVGPYNWEAVDIQVRSSYTNTSPGSSYRGFGGVHGSLPGEVQLDETAEILGKSPYDFRMENLVERDHEFWPGKRRLHADVKANLRQVAEGIKWGTDEPENTGKGLGLIVMDSGAVPIGRSEVRLHGDGSVTVLTGSAELGQGSRTVLAMVAAEEFGVSLDKVRISMSDSGVAPYARSTGADRTTIMEGTTIWLACQDIKGQMREMAAEIWEASADGITTDNDGVHFGPRFMPWSEVIERYFTIQDMEVSGRGHIRPKNSEWALIPPSWENPIVGARVEADPETGEWWVKSLIDVADIGLALNPTLADGMDTGSLIQSLGIAMREQLVYDGQQLSNGSVLGYRVPEMADIPDEMHTFVVENRDGMGPYGSKAHGDGSMSVVAPAIANALYDAIGVRMHKAPFTPERVWQAMRDRDAGVDPNPTTGIPDWWKATDWTDRFAPKGGGKGH